MFPRKIIKGLLIPSYAGVGVVNAKSDQDQKDDCDDTKKLIRPRDLPLYVEPPKCVTCSNTIDNDEGFLLTTIRCARQELQSIYEQAKVIQSEVETLADEAHKNTKDVVDYLRQEENLLPRLGAIGLGGFAGYLLACRKGYFKKVLYSVAGASAVTALAYPTMTKEYGEMFLCEVKKGVVIGYHFLNGAPIDYKKLETIQPPCVTKKGGDEGGKGEDNKTGGIDKPTREESFRSTAGNYQEPQHRRRSTRSPDSYHSSDTGGMQSGEECFRNCRMRPRTRRRDKGNQNQQEEPRSVSGTCKGNSPIIDQPAQSDKLFQSSEKPACGGRYDDPTVRSPRSRSVQPDGQPELNGATSTKNYPSQNDSQQSNRQPPVSQADANSTTPPGPPFQSCQEFHSESSDNVVQQRSAQGERSNWNQRCDSQDSSSSQNVTTPTNGQNTPCKSVVKKSSVEVTYPTAPGSEECTVHCPESFQPSSRGNDTPAKVSASVTRSHLEARLLRSDGVTPCRCRHEPFR